MQQGRGLQTMFHNPFYYLFLSFQSNPVFPRTAEDLTKFAVQPTLHNIPVGPFRIPASEDPGCPTSPCLTLYPDYVSH
jgi:hypothetical protein